MKEIFPYKSILGIPDDLLVWLATADFRHCFFLRSTTSESSKRRERWVLRVIDVTFVCLIVVYRRRKGLITLFVQRPLPLNLHRKWTQTPKESFEFTLKLLFFQDNGHIHFLAVFTFASPPPSFGSPFFPPSIPCFSYNISMCPRYWGPLRFLEEYWVPEERRDY